MTALVLWLLLHAPDGGAVPSARPALKPEDQEVVKNLELLEHLDETADLELLQELSAER